MNRFGYKTIQNSTPLDAPNFMQQTGPAVLPHSLILQQNIGFAQYDSSQGFLSRVAHDLQEDSDEESLDEQELSFLFHQNVLLSSLINEIQNTINAVPMQVQRSQSYSLPCTKLNVGGLRRTANGIRKIAAAAGPESFSLIRIKPQKKTKKAKTPLIKKLEISRKIARRMLLAKP